MNLLQRDIAEPLTGLIGGTLERVVYHPLKGECTADDLNASHYIGGEIALYLQALAPKYISWAENAGWRSHFTVKVSAESAFCPGALETFDASNTILWRETIGRTLTEVECLGWDQSPHVLKLTFEAYPRFIGSSYHKRFGDGDDLFFCDVSEMPDLSGTSVIWRNNKANKGRNVDNPESSKGYLHSRTADRANDEERGQVAVSIGRHLRAPRHGSS